jgi:hypothetical protein
MPRSIEATGNPPVRLLSLPDGEPAAAEKQLRRQVQLNGQETWEDIPDAVKPAAGGGAMEMPPVPGGVPGFAAGAEPPRWDGSSPQPRVLSAPDDADDAEWPQGRAISERPHAAFPSGPQCMDGYWPAGQVQPQSSTSSSGGARGVPPSTVGGSRKTNETGTAEKPGRDYLAAGAGKTISSLATGIEPGLVKVGKEGYIHGFICVRPPCGPVYTEARFDSSKGSVDHEGTRIGKMRKNPNGTYSMTHYAADDTKTKLTAEHPTRAAAALSIGAFHDVDAMHHDTADGPVKDALESARDSLATGDTGAATRSLRDAADAARVAGDTGLASHVDHVRSVLSGEDAVEPKPITSAVPKKKPSLPQTPTPLVPQIPVTVPKPVSDDLKQDVSYAGLDVQAIKKELNDIADSIQGGPDRFKPGSFDAYPTDDNFRSLGNKLTTRDGEDKLLKPSKNIFGEHIRPKAAENITEYIKQLKSIADGSRGYGVIPDEAGQAKIATAIDRAKAVRKLILAADTTPPLRPGVLVQQTKELSGGLDDNLSAQEANSLRAFVKRGAFKLATDDDVAEMHHLKGTYIMNTLEKAGLPHNAAYLLAGGVGKTADDDYIDKDGGLSYGGIDGMVGEWSMQGDGAAERISQIYDESMRMTEPPQLLDTDYAGAHNPGFQMSYNDMSKDASMRRKAAATYWLPRAQKMYTDQVLKEIKAPEMMLVSRYVGGDYADKIRASDRIGAPWQAATRTLSSWAAPKGVKSAKNFVNMSQRGEPLMLSQSVPRDSIFMHWRGEPTLRNEVKVLGEVVPIGVMLSNENTTVGEPA